MQIKIDGNGNEIWQKYYKEFGLEDYEFKAIASTTGNGTIMLGDEKSNPFAPGPYYLLLVKTNPMGEVDWFKKIETDTLPIGAISITKTSKNNFFISGYSVDSNWTSIGILIKTDSLGEIKWIQKKENGILRNMIATENENISTSSFGNYLAAYDSTGNFKWEKKLFIAQSNNTPSKHISCLDGGFALTQPINFGNGFWDFWPRLIKTDSLGNIFNNSIFGKAFIDEDSCDYNYGEIPLSQWIVKGESNDYFFYKTTDVFGNYHAPVDTGSYSVEITPTGPYWAACASPISTTVDSLEKDTVDFPIQALVECPYLETSITTPFLRRCSTSVYYVQYCNFGTIPSDTAFIQITLDTFLNFINSSIPITSQNGNILTFKLDTIGIGECSQFTIEVEVDCAAQLGQTHCVEAHIYPDSLCLPTPSWLGGSVEVNGTCVNDTIHFSIKNKGNTTLSPGLEYIVIEDDVILKEEPINQLMPGGVQEVSVANIGATYRLESDQEPNHPGNSMPTYIIEGCGQGFTPGFVNLFPMDDADPYIDIDCRENIGSYDPNDKLAFPIGYDDEHFIEQNIDLEYLIRFQNTGTDTAFRVVIRDTLSPFLDVASVRPGASSHNYNFDISGPGILKFTFDNILLPDSTTNLSASQGFIKYRISQKENVPLGSVINNSAAIYFDFNEPVITNTTYHTVGEDFVPMVVSVNEKINKNISVNVLPNPFTKKAKIEINGITFTGEKSFLLFNSSGQLIRKLIFDNNHFEINGDDLNSGVYYFRIINAEGFLAAGKVVIVE
ncbi:MAG: T9SS type A sorting domain-containing protein [Saprospiraceae bacterium]